MNNLKKYAGLLNEEAPENHFLAYITPKERDMLIEAGGVKTPTSSGIFAYPPQDNYTTSYDSSQNKSGRTSSTSGAGGGSGYSGSNNNDNSNNDIDSTYTSTSFDVTPEPVEKNFFEKVVDFVKGGGVVGSVLKSIGGKLNLKNKYEGITGEDGIGEGDFVYSSPNEYSQYEYGYNYKDLDTETQAEIDKAFYDSGHRSKAFQEFYNDGDTSNLNDLTNTERNEINKIIPNLPDAIGGTTSQESMVNKYFANIGSNLGVSSAYMDTYNDAKTKIANTLNLTPNTQQYGYGNIANDNFARSMTSANPFFDELTTQGLI